MAQNPTVTPLDLPLHDIHLPAVVSWWPLAPGWWGLCALVLVLLVAGLGIRRFRQRRRLRRLALRQLDDLAKLPQNQLITPLSRLLRQAAISHFPRNETAGLNGHLWLQFLDSPFNDCPFSSGIGRCLGDAPYRPAVQFDDAAVVELCRRWLRKLPPQQLSFWRGK